MTHFEIGQYLKLNETSAAKTLSPYWHAFFPALVISCNNDNYVFMSHAGKLMNVFTLKVMLVLVWC